MGTVSIARLDSENEMSINDTFQIGIHSTVYHHELRTLRTGLAMTQQELAETAGIPLPRLQKIEQIKKYPYEDEAVAIADILDADPHDLFPKWTMPAYNSKNRIADRVVDIEISQLETEKVLQIPSGEDLERRIERDEMKEQIEQMLDTLEQDNTISKRQKLVLIARFGLNDKGHKTYEEIAKTLGVTRERIRQIEKKALLKIRKECRLEGLSEYI